MAEGDMSPMKCAWIEIIPSSCLRDESPLNQKGILLENFNQPAGSFIDYWEVKKGLNLKQSVPQSAEETQK